MNQNVTSNIKSNLALTDDPLQNPVAIAVPSTLTPNERGQSSSIANNMAQNLMVGLSVPDSGSLNLSETQHFLSQADFEVNWQQCLHNQRLDHFVDQGFIVLDTLYQSKALLALQAESGFINYRDAKLTEGVRLSNIRGDHIRWITPDFFAGSYYLQNINELAQLFNRILFAGIRHSEAHYACYPPGFGYQWHSDNPVGRDERVISAVFYLNDEWTAEDGGALSLIDAKGKQHQLLPKANRLVIFDSNLQHQVEIAHRQRYSIATWLRRDDTILLP